MRENLPQVAVVVLNWNRSEDTMECLNSIFQSTYPNFQVILCDNGSTDDSVSRIISWAKGEQRYIKPETSPVQHRNGLENIPEKVIICSPEEICSNKIDRHKKLILIPIGKNYGFAGGNNVGIKWAISNDDIDHVWLLNNDTVVTPTALAELVKKTRTSTGIGICGSTILHYDKPNTVQTLGGSTFNKWIASSKYILPNQKDSNLDELQYWVENQMDMVLGASMFVSTEFINEVGLLSEDYYLFAEEIDWCTRAGNKYPLGYAPASKVYHKRGKSTGSSRNPLNRTIKTDYYNTRSRLIFTRKFYPWRLPTVYLSLIPMIFNRLRRRQTDRASVILDIMMESLFYPDKFYSNSNRGLTF